jgi:hypothetical protein
LQTSEHDTILIALAICNGIVKLLGGSAAFGCALMGKINELH